MNKSLLVSFVLLTACRPPSRPIQVGSKKFTESVLLGEMATQLLRASGFNAAHDQELGGTRILWSALTRGDLDVYPEYTGTLKDEVLAGKMSAGQTLDEALGAAGVVASPPLGFSDTYALGVPGVLADRLGLHRISDLAQHPELRLGFSHEFLERKDGWPAVRERYGLVAREARGLSHELAYRALRTAALDVTDLYSTDPEIVRDDIRLLEDDRRVFPDYQAVLLVREAWAKEHPEARAALFRLAGAISLREMRDLNAQATLAKVPEPEVAARFLARRLSIHASADGLNRARRIWRRTGEHALLVAGSLLAATFVAVPLGILCARRRRLGQALLAAAGVVQTIPSLALLVLLLPLFGIGEWPALAALFTYSLLPILRNTFVGLAHLPAELRMAALALGLPDGFKLWRIELPLASPAILAGVKTAAVLNVGTATLGALIGAGGYGQPILQGIRLDSLPLLLEGAIPAAVMALLVQGLFELCERWVVPRGLRLGRR